MTDIRPRKLRKVCWVMVVIVLVVFAVIAVVLPQGAQQDEPVTPADQVAFFLIGVLLATALIALTRFRVRADTRGIWVRNVMGERYFPWGVVVGVHLGEGSPWAQLELQDDETVSLMALQSNDGDTTVDAVLSLRKLLQTAGSPQ